MNKETILEQTKHPSSSKRREAAQQLSEFKDIDSIETLIYLLSDSSLGVSDAAFQSLTKIANEDLIKHLLSLIVSKDYRLESAAFDLLSRIGTPYLSLILNYLETTQDHNEKKVLLDIIGNLKIEEQYLDHLRDILSSLINTEDPNIRLTTSETIGKLNLVSCLDALSQRLSIETEEWVKYVLEDAIHAIKGRSSLEEDFQE
jgi:HEAT repeat protein